MSTNQTIEQRLSLTRKELQTMKVRKFLLTCGILSSLLYAAGDIIAGTLWHGYSFISQAFSDLPAIYSPVRQFILPFIMLRGVILLAFALGVWIWAGRNRALKVTALMLIGDNVVGLITPIFFPPPSAMHAPLTGVEVIFILLAIGSGAIAFKKWFRFYSVGTIMILIATGVWAFMQVSQYTANGNLPWFGVIERILIYSYLLWVAMFAVVLLRAQGASQVNMLGTNDVEHDNDSNHSARHTGQARGE